MTKIEDQTIEKWQVSQLPQYIFSVKCMLDTTTKNHIVPISIV